MDGARSKGDGVQICCPRAGVTRRWWAVDRVARRQLERLWSCVAVLLPNPTGGGGGLYLPTNGWEAGGGAGVPQTCVCFE